MFETEYSIVELTVYLGWNTRHGPNQLLHHILSKDTGPQEFNRIGAPDIGDRSSVSITARGSTPGFIFSDFGIRCMLELDDVDKYASILRRDGVVVIEDYLDADTCERLYEEAEGLIQSDEITRAGSNPSYEELMLADEPILNFREGERDHGMIDIFHVDLLFSELLDIKQDSGINRIINAATDKAYSPDNINIYRNEGVTETRGFHADTYSGKFKSFVYLTDVLNDSYGPFSYVRESHKKSKVEQTAYSLYNKVKGNKSTDAVSYDETKAETFTASKGTLIIANQAGYHRGMPQDPDKHRMLVTTSYTPE